ncbi:cadherin-like domain-containing protein [Desulfomicrobium sp. ZS1]|uniref:cadherin-like domain-containing protein n=1 Tax=Desulfomicrobium sp. ZS1 TaxID=2952228 RepID=UPI0020B3D997|nr:cadherin-like domain-containing protein [Desulfomicrobium sp. ZS1]UTF48808.1 cadherin-like domain-containing protein [Desulfomicrobium sp. ZS1]
MFKNQGIVLPSDGKANETEAVTGGLEPLNPGVQLPVVAVDGLDADAAAATDAAVAAPESDLEVAMSALGALPEDQVAGLKTVAATSSSSVSEAESEVFSSDTQIRQALGIHQASVGSTEFLDRATGDDFGMTEFLESVRFSATPGDDLAGRGIEDEVEWEGLAWFRTSPEGDSLLVLGTVDLGDMDEDGSMLITEAGLLARVCASADVPLFVTGLRLTEGSGVVTSNGDGTWTFTPAADWNGNVALSYRVSDGDTSSAANAALTVNPVNDAPVIAVNDALLVDDLTAQSLAGSLSATDVDNDAADLLYTITRGPVNGVLLVDGVEITDFSQPVFTQADIDGGRVTFRFDTPQPGDEIRVVEDDSFVFSVTDGSLSTSETTFNIRNSAVQIWGTNEADDLTGAADFSREGVTFHVFGFDGNDTMRGGSGAETLDGGGHAFASHTPWLNTQEGGDTVDYGASTAAVDVDLTREAQTGGHAEGDVLIDIENVIGSGFDDSIAGNAASNLLVGLDGDDTLLGGEGNDTLRGGAGVDLIDGGLGWDFADYRDSAGWVNVDLNIQDGLTAQSGGGTDNDALGDTLVGIEHLIGSDDASHGDVLTGNAASNHLIGLDGDDTLIGGAGNDTLVGGAGADVLSGGTGTRDLADYSSSTAWVNVDLTKQDGTTAQTGGGAGNHAEGDILTGIEDVNGSAYDDSILGSTASNVLSGYGGNDTIDGGAGYDIIRGGDGDDLISGGDAWDSLYGDAGNDTVYGGNGIDTIFGGDGDDYLVGFNSDGTSDGIQDFLIGGAGNDTLDGSHVVGDSYTTLVGGSGADRIIGNGVNTSASYELTGPGDYNVSDQGVYVDLRLQGPDADGSLLVQTGKPGGDDATGDILTGIVNLVGSNGADTLIGNHQNNYMAGVEGDDLLIGKAGNDSLEGLNGNDTLEGGLGADFIWGGMEYDIASYANAATGVNVSLDIQYGGLQSGAGEENGDALWYMDGLYGSEHNDTLTGSSHEVPELTSIHNLIEGRGGDDILSGLAGNDTLDGGAGNDTLMGGEGDDLLIGGAGDDLIHAGAGDTVEGGADFDALRSEDMHLDVASSTTMTGIERIDLVGVGESLRVTGDAIVGNGVLDPVGDGAHALILTGDAGDHVDLSGDTWNWTLAAQDADIGDGRIYTVYEATGVGGTVRLYIQNGLAVDSGVNDAPVVSVNETLLVDDMAAQSLAGSLSATDTDNDAADLRYTITHGPANGVLLLGGVTVTDFSQPVFTQADIDGGRVTFRFDTPQPGDEIRVVEDDSFVFSVTDGSLSTSETTFNIRNSAVQIWGTNEADDLTSAADFSREGVTFHIYGFDGNDTLRGGAGADTLDGGAGIDTADYGASDVGVNVDLTRAAQTGGQAEGDSLTGIENIISSNFNDTLTGDANHNLFDGGAGDDTLIAGAGNDTLIGGAGADSMDGGTDTDVVDYSGSASWVQVDLNLVTAQVGGGDGNDAQGDILAGIENLTGTNDAGHGDVLTGDFWHNLLIGLDGDDTLIGGSGSDTLIGGVGADSLDGGLSADMVDYSASVTWVNVDLSLATAQTGGGDGNHALGDTLVSIERVIGTNDTTHGDVLTGSVMSNLLYGLDGDDTISGGGFYDTIRGGDGDDWIDGGTHEDSIFGDAGNDTIYGGNGIDTIFGGDGDDYLVGFNSDGTSDGVQDFLIGGWGNDTLDGSHGVGDSYTTLVGGSGADRIIGNGVNTSASYELTGPGDYNVSDLGVYVDLGLQGPDADGNLLVQTGKPGGDDATGDILTGIVNLVGSNGADTLIGNHQNNYMAGVEGDDLLIGGDGNDSLEGLHGNDTLDGGLGADFIWGGMEYDIASYANAATGVNVSLDIQYGGLQSGAGEENGDALWYMDGLYGSEHNDTLTGSSHEVPELTSIHNLIEGRGGDDILSGLAGNDTLDGGAGNDTLIGGAGDDLLIGGEGDDLLVGGITDVVDGGDGFDTFRLEDNIGTAGVFDLGAMNDAGRITGIERIDITGDADDANTLTLRAEDVFEVSGGSLYVDGDAGDGVTTMGAGWTQEAADVSHEGQTYHHYTAQYDSQTINLYVETTLAYQNEI